MLPGRDIEGAAEGGNTALFRKTMQKLRPSVVKSLTFKWMTATSADNGWRTECHILPEKMTRKMKLNFTCFKQAFDGALLVLNFYFLEN